MAHLSDQALINLYLTTQDKQCFAQLYTRHRYRVYQLCLCYCGHPDEADDFTQEIFLRILNKLGSFNGNSEFTTWLHRITVNYCIDHIRERQQRQGLYQRYFEETGPMGYRHDEAEEMSFQVMEQVMQSLPTHELELLQSKYGESRTLKTIAGQKQLSLSAVKMRIKRARDQARTLYNHLYAYNEGLI